MLINPQYPLPQSAFSSALQAQHVASLGHDELHFGRTSNDYPDKSVKHVQMPNITQSVLKNAQRDFRDNKLKIFPLIWNLVRYRREENKANNYLPKKIKSRIFWYKHIGQWPDRIFKNISNPGYAQRKLVSLQGALVVKAKQAKVNYLRTAKPQLEGFEDDVNKAKKEGRIPWIERPAYSIAFRLIRQQLKEIQTYSGLFDEVPRSKAADYAKDIKDLKKAFKRKTGLTITEVVKPLGSGSIRQTFLAKVSDGSMVALKVNHPDSNDQFFDQFLPMLYYQALLLNGTEKYNRHTAFEQAKAQLHMIKREANQTKELAHNECLQQEFSRLGFNNLDIPEILVATKRGIVETVGGAKSYSKADASQQNKVLLKIAPDLIQALVFSYEKYRDLQPGNIMYDYKNGEVTRASIIDHGSNFTLDHEDYQSFQGFYASMMSLDWSKPLTDQIDNVMPALEYLKPLVNDNVEGSQSLDSMGFGEQLKLLKTVESIIRSPRDTSLISTVVAPWAFFSTGLDAINRKLPIQLLNIGTNSMSPMETQRYQRQAHSLLKPYFWAVESSNEDKELSDELMSMSADDWKQTFAFNDPFTGKEFYGHTSSLCKEIPGFSTLDSAFRSVLRAEDNGGDRLDKALEYLEKEREKIKEDSPNDWDLIVHAYRVNKRVKALAETIASGLSGDSTGTYENLLTNVEYALRKDFGLRYATPNDNWRNGDFDSYLWASSGSSPSAA